VVDIDIAYLDSTNWIDEDMHERFRWLRDRDPVHWSEKDDVWVITRYEDVSRISKDQATFTSAEGVRPTLPVKIGLIDEGEPRHSQLRGLINKGFTPRMVKQLEEVFRGITKEAIDSIAKQGHADFVHSISVPLPLRLIAAMIGIRPEDYDQFHEWSDAMIAAEGNMGNPEIIMKAGQSAAAYAAYVTPIIEDRRKNPKDDLMSILTGAADAGIVNVEHDDAEEAALSEVGLDGREMHNDELIKLMVILMVAGNETTRNGISGGMQLLIDHPEAKQRLIDDPSLIPQACEEMLRVNSPVRSFSRTVLKDVELHDKLIRKGDKVLIVYTSANRDERQFENADEFDIDRNAAHLAFGIGSHFCLGANLARMEMRVAFSEILKRMPDITYATDGPVFQGSALVRTCAEMQVRFTPEA
jgi:cytochrome P450